MLGLETMTWILLVTRRVHRVHLPIFTLPPKGGRSNCDGRVCMSVRTHYLKKRQSKLHEISCTCYPGPWLGPSLTTMEYVMYFRFVDDVIFSHNGAWRW